MKEQYQAGKTENFLKKKGIIEIGAAGGLALLAPEFPFIPHLFVFGLLSFGAGKFLEKRRTRPERIKMFQVQATRQDAAVLFDKKARHAA